MSRLRVRRESAFFVVVVLTVAIVGLLLAWLIGRWYQYPPAIEWLDLPGEPALQEYAPAPFGVDEAVPVAGGVGGQDAVQLLARLIQAEAANEPYVGKVAVGAVVLNRVQHASFPKTIPGVIFQPRAFQPVANGRIWLPVEQESYRAARQALAGWDPTHGALYFWNPAKSTSPWIWTRTIITRIGRHVFGR